MQGSMERRSCSRKNNPKRIIPFFNRIVVAMLACTLILGQMPLVAWGDEIVSSDPVLAADGQAEFASAPSASGQGGESSQGDESLDVSDGLGQNVPSVPGEEGESSQGEESSEGAQGSNSLVSNPADKTEESREGDTNGVAEGDSASDSTTEANSSEENVEVDPDEELTMTVTVIGLEDDLETETVWLYKEPVSAPVGTEATDYLAKLFDKFGMNYHVKYGDVRKHDQLASLSSPDGSLTLGDTDDFLSSKDWYLFRDGETAEKWTCEVGEAPAANQEWVLAYRLLPGSVPDIKPESINTFTSIIGPDSAGFDTYWDVKRYAKVSSGTNVADVSLYALTESGLIGDVDSRGNIEGIVSPYTGIRLGDNGETGKAWRLFINGKAVSDPADSVHIDSSAMVVWYYAEADAKLPDEGELARSNVSFSVSDHSGDRADYWVGADFGVVEEGTTLLELIKDRLDKLNMSYEIETLEDEPGFFFITSITSDKGITRESTGWNDDDPSWHVFVNGVQYDQTSDATRVVRGGDSVDLSFCVEDEPLDSKVVLFSVAGLNNADEPTMWASKVPLRFSAKASGAEAVQALAKSSGLTVEYATADNGRTYVKSIASPNGKKVLESQGPGANGEFAGANWHAYVNGEDRGCWLDRVGSFDAPLREGDVVTLFFTEGAETLPEINGELDTTHPDAPRPDWDADDGGFTTGRVIDGDELSGEYGLSWTFEYGRPDASEPLIVNGNVYLATGSTLNRIDAKTGEIVGSVDMVATIDYTCRPVYAEGLVVVPLSSGRLAAYTADALELVWYTDAVSLGVDGVQQSVSSLVYVDGCVMTSTMAGAGPLGTSESGSVYCVDIRTGEVVWRQDNLFAGYYWAGAALMQGGKFALLAGDDGYVRAYNMKTGEIADEYPLGEPVRSGLAAADDSLFYAMTSNGNLMKLMVDESGKISPRIGWQVLSESTASPVISNGRIYVAGSMFGQEAGKGELAVIDLETGAVEWEITTDENGDYLPGRIQGTPLVVERESGTYVYFVCNASTGAVYEYRVGDDHAKTLFVPEESHQNYSIASLHMDSAGNLYYTNDAGYLFCLGIQGSDSGKEPGVPPVVNPDGGSGNGNGAVRLPVNGGFVSWVVGTNGPSALAKGDGADRESMDENRAVASLSSVEGPYSEAAAFADAGIGENRGATGSLAPAAIAGMAIGAIGLAIGLALFARSRKDAE